MRSTHRPRRCRPTSSLLAALAVSATLLVPSVASGASTAPAADPPLTVPKARLAAALHCPVPVTKKAKAPILLVTGTGMSGRQAWSLGGGVLVALGRPACYVDFPYATTGDIQISVQYLVHGVRTMARTSGKKVSLFGVSQGGLLSQLAATYWPGLRKQIDDIVTVAGSHRGSNALGPCSTTSPCRPAEWQQMAGSKLLTALHRQRDETPGAISWTTIRTATDEVVKPQDGPRPASALKGATNILIQDVCPGRVVKHIPSALDAMSVAAFVDAVSHRGAAKVSRLPKDVCSRTFAADLTVPHPDATIRMPPGPNDDPQTTAPGVPREPSVLSLFRKRVR